MRAAWLGLLTWVVACEGTEPPPPPPLHPCASDLQAFDVAPPDGEYGDLVDGGILWCGDPPQGGAPYTPFRLRVSGSEALADGVLLEMAAYDAADGSELAYTDIQMGVTCANVGDNAGFWVGSEAHMRYYGFLLEELDGRSADVDIRVTPLADPTQVLEGTWQVDLVLQ